MGAAQEGLTGALVAVADPAGWRTRLERLPIDRRTVLSPVELAGDAVTIRCGGAAHQARVDGDRLVLTHHDVESELTMAVFGGELPECLLYLAAWEDAATDGFLAAWAADADDERLDHDREDWAGNYWESWPNDPPPARVLFGPRLQRHLALVCASRWTDRRGLDGPGAAWASVRRAVSTRARRALVLSLAGVDAHRRPDALVPVDLTVTPEGAPGIRGVLSRSRSHISLRLPASWLHDVWSGDGALVAGYFVLGRTASSCSIVRWTPTGGDGRAHEPVVVEVPSTG